MDDRKEQTEATTAKVEFAHNLIKSAVTHAAARLRYTIKAVHGCSGRAMVIKDAVEKLPVLRLDYTHAGHNYAHWNVNWKLLWKVAKTRDPHLPASPMALHTGEASNRTAVLLEKVGPALTATALIVDTARISHAAYSDYNAGSSVPTTTMKTTANVAGAYARGYGGAVTGGVVGAKVGAGVGWLFGPAGTLAGAAIGGVAGGIGGAVGGAFGGAFAAEKATEKAIDVATDADKRAGVLSAAEAAGRTVHGAAAAAGHAMHGAAAALGGATVAAAATVGGATASAGQIVGTAAWSSTTWLLSFMPDRSKQP